MYNLIGHFFVDTLSVRIGGFLDFLTPLHRDLRPYPDTISARTTRSVVLALIIGAQG